MKHLYFYITTSFFALFLQFAVAQNSQPCLTEVLFREKINNDPQILDQRRQIMENAQRFANNNDNRGGVRIIPMVFHVIHEGGAENISKAQILDQVRILNEDYRRLNADATNTPAAFLPVAADCNIEFRLAQLDPNGNCTDGIERIYSSLTNNARDNVKALSDWPMDKYLNIWVVKSIETTGTGIVLGYAQFPPPLGGNANTDGVVLRADFVGSIGSANGNGYFGRTATHEIGHWFGLLHIWGDDNGACTGTDYVADTPNQASENYWCPVYPHVTCSNGPNGDMFQNYMDYSDGSCENLFTAGQKNVMDNTLTTARTNNWSAANLTATGTDVSVPSVCVPRADFYADKQMICYGDSIKFTDYSWNADVATRDWSFPGGTPSTGTDSSIWVTYPTAGVYQVTLRVYNASGGDTLNKTTYIYVSSGASAYTAPYHEGFEGGSYPNVDWYIFNPDAGATYAKVTTAHIEGAASLKINNATSNSDAATDELVGPSIDLTTCTNPILTFQTAYKQKTASTTSTESLKVLISTTCGKYWTQRMALGCGTSFNMVTQNAQTSPFTPTSSQWKFWTVNIAPYGTSHNFRMKFVYTNGNRSNNFYIDDINIMTANSTADLQMNEFDFDVAPNPASDEMKINYFLPDTRNVLMELTDLTGRKVQTVVNEKLEPGRHEITLSAPSSAGIYFLTLRAGEQTFVRKVVFTR